MGRLPRLTPPSYHATYIPMDGTIKNILNAVVVIAVVLWLLQVFGILGEIRAVSRLRSCQRHKHGG